MAAPDINRGRRVAALKRRLRKLFMTDLTGRSRGVALVIVLVMVVVMSAFAVEFSFEARVDVYATSNLERDIKAYYHARSGIELTRLVLKKKAQLEQMARGMNMESWQMIAKIVEIFTSKSFEIYGIQIIDLSAVQGIGVDEGTFKIVDIVPEDGKVNLNWFAKRALLTITARELFGLLKPKEIEFFEEKEPKIWELICNMIDWVDADENRTEIDEQTRNLVMTGGVGEDSLYGEFKYKSKNAKFDTIEELMLVAGMTDRIYEYLEDTITIYPTTQVNVNTADIRLLKSILCEYVNGDRDILCGYTMLGLISPIDEALLLMEQCRQIKTALFSPAFNKPQEFVAFFQKIPPQLLLSGQGMPAFRTGEMLKVIKTTSDVIKVISRGKVGNTIRDIEAIINAKTGQIYRWRVTNGM